MKKIAIIGTAGVPGKYGGFETLAHHLVKQLNQEYNISVYNSRKYYPKNERVKTWNNARIYYIPLNANGAQSILYDILSILHAALKNDVLLILGVSGGIILPFIKLFTRKKIIVNIDGLEWRRQKWNKLTRMFLKFSERLAVRFSHADITDNIALKRYTSTEYNTLSHLIEYGSDHVVSEPETQVDFRGYEQVQQYIQANQGNYAMKVCRIEPENNIHMVLDAFSKTKNLKLVLVGNWNNSEYGINLKKQYKKYDNISLLNPIYNQNILDELRRNCFVYVHGHSAGGTNPSLVEAMGLGLPIIAYNVVYNVETTENEALYFNNSEQLIEVLNSTTFSTYKSIRKNLKTIADERYTWNRIAQKYSNLIKAVYQLKQKQVITAEWSKLNLNTLLHNEIAHLKNSAFFFEKLN